MGGLEEMKDELAEDLSKEMGKICSVLLPGFSGPTEREVVLQGERGRQSVGPHGPLQGSGQLWTWSTRKGFFAIFASLPIDCATGWSSAPCCVTCSVASGVAHAA